MRYTRSANNLHRLLVVVVVVTVILFSIIIHDDVCTIHAFVIIPNNSPRTTMIYNKGVQLLVNNSENDEELILRRQNVQHLAGQMNQQLQKAVSRDNRISQLQEKLDANNDTTTTTTTNNIKKELHGLLQKRETYEEQYNSASFTQAHLEFKDMHNDAFIQLTKYCEHERQRIIRRSRLLSRSLRQTTDEGKTITATTTPTVTTTRTRTRTRTTNNTPTTTTTNLFYLDGPDSRTSTAVIQKGNYTPAQCYVANRHPYSCALLRQILPETNVLHATCCEAFTTTTTNTTIRANKNNSGHSSSTSTSTPPSTFASIDFTSYYFDGCGGYVPHIIDMISSALVTVGKVTAVVEEVQEGRNNGPAGHVSLPIIIGYSVLGGAKDVIDKELQINRAITTIAQQQLKMRMIHVLDNPQKYGLSTNPTLSKISETSNTFTTWLLLEPE